MLKDTLPEDAFDPSWIGSYRETIDVIWRQLVRLNSNIYALEKLFAFPFALFVGPISRGFFWKLTENALFDSCVLIIWKVAVDNDFEKGVTLQKFKGRILKHLRNDVLLKEFKKALKETDFKKAFPIYESKILELRHNYIAHLNLEKHTKPTSQE
ncbi:MAG: hypothetical protein AAB354_05330, partial [candidate division KSB1 bacterium]